MSILQNNGAVSSMRDENDIVIYHIGGEGDYGPAMDVVRRFPRNVRLVIFEARSDTTDLAAAGRLDANGIRMTVVNRAVDEKAGTSDFYVNKFPLSSSLLPPSPIAVDEDPVYSPHWGPMTSWGQNTELDKVITVDTVSIDQIVAEGIVPPPDIISIDAQGAELRILRGARETLSKHCLAVISEVEFFEIYDTQGLFDDQMQELGQHGFRLVNIFNQQNWHPTSAAGRGFLTVGEAVFIRFLHELPRKPGDPRRCYTNPENLSDEQLVRLMAIALGFGLYSYSYRITGMIKARSLDLFEQMRTSPLGLNSIILYEHMENNMAEYIKNPNFFLQTIVRA